MVKMCITAVCMEAGFSQIQLHNYLLEAYRHTVCITTQYTPMQSSTIFFLAKLSDDLVNFLLH